MYKLCGKRRRNHVKPVDKDVLPLEHTAALHARAHLDGDILRIGQPSLHLLLVCGIQQRCVLELPPRYAPLRQLLCANAHLHRCRFAALEIGDERRDLRGESACTAFCRAAVKAEVLLLLRDDLAEHHSFSALVEGHALRRPCTLKYARLKPSRRKHVNQKAALQPQPAHDFQLSLQRILRRNDEHAALSGALKRADSAHTFAQKPVRSCRNDLHDALHCFT